MSIEIHVPTLPESVADATIITLHKRVGERVEREETLIDLETDKIVLEVPAPQSGVIRSFEHQVGDTVNAGELLAVLEAVDPRQQAIKEDSDKPASTTALGKPADQEPLLSPAARKLIQQNQLDATAVSGSGKDQRITKQDVLRHIAAQQVDTRPAAEERPSPATPQVEPEWPASASAQQAIRERREPMSRIRQRIAERLLQAQREAAVLTTFNEVNMQAVMDARSCYKEEFFERFGARLGFMPFFVKACVQALKQFPVVNASIDGDHIVYHDYYDIGIAVSTERGLVVPVLRDAEQASFSAIEQQIVSFAERAQAGKLTIDDLSGGTFSITNGGVFGSMLSTPLLNPPQSAILGMHSIQQRPVVEEGAIVARPVMYIALSYDHRLIDGRDAVQFLVSVKRALEDPSRLLIGL
jgi:2-oxoglutarate dehydrogenase E2 component (dihydrolipoamide succinyltransferase)